MKNFITKLIIYIIVLFVVAQLMPGINVDSWDTLIVASLVLAFINIFVKPLVMVITLPINIFSLGLFTFFINGLMFYFVSKIVRGFTITNFWNAFWGAILFGTLSFFIDIFVNSKKSFVFYGNSRGANYDKVDNDKIIDI